METFKLAWDNKFIKEINNYYLEDSDLPDEGFGKGKKTGGLMLSVWHSLLTHAVKAKNEKETLLLRFLLEQGAQIDGETVDTGRLKPLLLLPLDHVNSMDNGEMVLTVFGLLSQYGLKDSEYGKQRLGGSVLHNVAGDLKAMKFLFEKCPNTDPNCPQLLDNYRNPYSDGLGDTLEGSTPLHRVSRYRGKDLGEGIQFLVDHGAKSQC